MLRGGASWRKALLEKNRSHFEGYIGSLAFSCLSASCLLWGEPLHSTLHGLCHDALPHHRPRNKLFSKWPWEETFCQNQHYSDCGDDPTGKVLATEAYRFEFRPLDPTIKSQLGLFTCVTLASVSGRGGRQNPGQSPSQSINPKFRERPCLKR